jgi:cytochrome P450
VAIAFDLFAPDVLADPYPLYAKLRKEHPVWRGPEGQWVVTRFADVAAALHDPRLSSATYNPDRVQAFPEPLRASVASMICPLQKWMVSQDPPGHTRQRAPVSKALTPLAVAAMRPVIQARVDALLDAVALQADPSSRKGSCDFIGAFAFRLPIAIVSLLLGLPDGDHTQFREWAYDLSVLWGPTNVPDVADRVRRCEASYSSILIYIGKIIEERRAHPTQDLISGMLAAGTDGKDGAPLSDEELTWNCVLMVLAGHETVTDTIGNGLLALIRHPDQWRLLRADPCLAANAIEEFLRYDAPFQFMQRIAAENLQIGGTSVARGDRVWLMLGAANRDPAAFDDPDRLDLTRSHSHQIAFGQGIHYCPGAPLARLEGHIAFTALARRFVDFRLATDKLEWLPKIPNRGLKALPVNFTVAG